MLRAQARLAAAATGGGGGGAQQQQQAGTDACADIAKALRLEPWLPSAYHWRGVALLALQDVAGAHAEFDKAISIEQPVQACTLFRRGAAAEMLGSCAPAIKDLSCAIELLGTGGGGGGGEELEPTRRVDCLAARRLAFLGLAGATGDQVAAAQADDDLADILRLEPDYVAGQLAAGADNTWSAGRLRTICPASAAARRRYCEMLLQQASGGGGGGGGGG
eukprot:SAG22_NODE_6390_length_862_cov_7.112713_1_plen_219_part_10